MAHTLDMAWRIVIQEELQPKTELERAFVQARSWDPMHSWRRGTTDLRSGRIGSAVGIYLALVRSQALTGRLFESEATLNSVDQYRDGLSVPDKLSAVRVLCSIMSEMREEPPTGRDGEQLQKSLTQSAFAFAAQIKEDKLAVMDALALIKRSSEFDVITVRRHQKQFEELTEMVERYKSTVPSPKDEISTERPITLEAILELANALSEQMQVLQILVSLGNYLLENRQIESAKLVCQSVLESTKELAKVSNSKTDVEISDILCAFGDKLFVKDCKEEACECFSSAIFARIRAKVFSDRSLEDVATISTNAVMSKQYDKCSKTLRNMLSLLEIQKDDSPGFELLSAHVQVHCHLVSILAQPDAKLDLRSLSGLKELVDQGTKFTGSPFYVDLLPQVAELLQSRVDKEYVNGIIDLLWNSAYDFPVSKTYKSYIIPLALLTEQMLGSDTPRAFRHYQKISQHMEKSKVDQKNLILFWRILSKMREETDGRNSPSLLPLLAALAEQNFIAFEYRDCLDIMERIRFMDMSDLSGINAGINTIPHYIQALLKLTELHVQLPSTEGDPLSLLSEVEKIAKANEKHEHINSEIRTIVLEFVASISAPGNPKSLLQIPPILDKAMKFKASE